MTTKYYQHKDEPSFPIFEAVFRGSGKDISILFGMKNSTTKRVISKSQLEILIKDKDLVEVKDGAGR